VRALDEAGLEIASLELIEPTLDDVFLAKTGHHLEGEDAAEQGERDPYGEEAPLVQASADGHAPR
jgi:hypothetical protein